MTKETVLANIPTSKTSSYILDKLNSLVLLQHQVWGIGWGEEEGETGQIREGQIIKGLVTYVKGLELYRITKVESLKGCKGKNDMIHLKFMKNYSGTISRTGCKKLMSQKVLEQL